MRNRLGVGGRLFLAFLGISGFAVLAAAAALYSFLAAGKALEQITQDRVPSAVASQQLSRQAERMAAAAPVLLTVNTAEEHERMSARLSADLARLHKSLRTLREQNTDPAILNLIERLVDRLDVNLLVVDTMVFNNLVRIERRNELLRDLRFTDIATRRLLAPSLLVLDAKLAELERALDGEVADDGERLHEIASLAETVVSLAPVRIAQAEVSAINDMLIKAASAESVADVGLLVLPLHRSLGALEDVLASGTTGLGDRLAPRLRDYRQLVDGRNSIVAGRKSELRHIALMRTLLDRNVEITRQLTTAVDRLVDGAIHDIQTANRDAHAVQQTSTAIMITVVALAVICAGLIVWLYVGRNLVARLTGLSGSMSAIADGDLQAPIPVGGTDEISAMAEALTVFRDTALVVRETNLREIREARRRLTDAIETISEGFSLYDASDCLVVCNSHYCETFYPGIADIVVPGAPFETFIRGVAERGLVADAKGRVEAWIAERLARHRAPNGVHVQRQSDGRWFQIDERKTEDGGTVAVYTDITDLKQREEQLSEKSNALEQLSNQLAKYLSPQIYDSIFRSRQEVKVTSSRKKLTVFFSDIANFTEMTDRLQSEELTGLLNHYLTEMSQIALEFGATIDKYVGDAIVIFFGDPETKGVKEDALACVSMAIAMRKRMGDLQNIWRDSGIERPLRCRMGIHTDYCTVGNFGSETRMDYTIVGGGVNLASRLETSATPGEIIISYETFAHVSDRIYCEENGEIEVKGMAYPVATYRVVDLFESLEKANQTIRAELVQRKVDVDEKLMSPLQRRDAAEALRDVADRLTQTNATASQTPCTRRS